MKKSSIIILIVVIILLILAIVFIVDYYRGNSQSVDKVLCVYEIPNELQFTCGNKTVTGMGISLMQYHIATDQSHCEVIFPQENLTDKTTHYEIADCNQSIPFLSTQIHTLVVPAGFLAGG